MPLKRKMGLDERMREGWIAEEHVVTYKKKVILND